MNKKSVLIICIFFSFVISSVFSQAKLSKNPDAMLWKIEGVDANGNPSNIYVLGTIHLGDDRLYPLPQCIIDAWADSDRFVSEISTEGWNKLQNSVNSMVIKSAAKARKSKRNIKNDLTEEEMDVIESLDSFVNQLYIFEPWVIQQIIDGEVQNTTDLKAEKSYDFYLTNIAHKAGITLEGLDELQVQLNLLSFGDWNFQLKMLRNSIEQYENPDEYNKQLTNLYESYLTNDEKIMEKNYLVDGLEKEIEEDPEMETYYKAMLEDRNKNWSEIFNKYLKEGGNIFIFAGTGHFIGEKSVFAIMKEKGYLF